MAQKYRNFILAVSLQMVLNLPNQVYSQGEWPSLWFCTDNIQFLKCTHIRDQNSVITAVADVPAKPSAGTVLNALSEICLFIVRRAGLLWSQQDFEWRRSVPLFKCLTVLEFSFILFHLCLLITFFIFIMNYVPIVTFWIFTYHKIWILSIMFCSIWSYWIIYFLACLEVSWRVVS